jgi:hypothetical protein
MTFPICPKCRFPLDQSKSLAECPNCGLVFAKYLAAQSGESESPSPDASDADGGSVWTGLLDAPPTTSKPVWLGRCALLIAFAVWGFSIWAPPITEMPGFIHLTLLPFHEAGHVFFALFGDFVRVAGGTLGQMIIPIVCAVALHLKGDNFGAALCTWWLGTSIIDTSIYAYDAFNPVMPLVGGGTGRDSFHDLVYLFTRMGQLKHARGIGHMLHALGGLVMLASLVWAALVLVRQKPTTAQ